MERRRRRRRRLRRRDAGRSRGAEAAEDVMDAPAGNRDGQRRVSDRKKKRKEKEIKLKKKKENSFWAFCLPCLLSSASSASLFCLKIARKAESNDNKKKGTVFSLLFFVVFFCKVYFHRCQPTKKNKTKQRGDESVSCCCRLCFVFWGFFLQISREECGRFKPTT